MFSFLFKKQKLIEDLLDRYLENLKQTQHYFREAIELCLNKDCLDDFDFMAEQTHKFESRADDIREEINNLMYSKALLPESRGDIMRLLEAIDHIPGFFEKLLNMMRTQKITIPDFLSKDIAELMDESIACCDLMITQVEALFKRKEDIRSLVSTIDHKESHCDHIVRRIISNLFDSDVDPFQKILIKEWIVGLGNISDQADRVSKRVNIISMKRTV